MTCYRPVRCCRTASGQIMFGVKAVQKSDQALDLPCGKCVGCRLEYSRQWALRCMHEASMHEHNCFVTLTYDNAHIPGDLSVDIREWQLFAKRLRKSGPFRFFACAEYGELNSRPHFHALIFGRDLRTGGELLRESPEGDLFSSKLLHAAWQERCDIRRCPVGAVTYESAAYVARYVMLKYDGAKAATAYERFDTETGECWSVRPPFNMMSRKPGIGSKWFDKYGKEVFPVDSVVWNGREHKPPRYYEGKLDPAFLAGVKEKRIAKAETRRSDDDSFERLEVRERCAVAKVKQLLRGIE